MDKNFKQIACVLLCLWIFSFSSSILAQEQTSLIVNGIPWYDQNHQPVNAHGAGIIRDNGKYWLFGEYKSDTSNAFPGFGCYSSEDLVNWHFERVVLPVQKDGILGPNRVGERVKVMRCPKTGMYVMLMHADDLKYMDPHIGIATCKTINGDYQLRGTLQYKGQPIKRWDMGVFQDEDGKGYLLTHHGPIYRLSDDYLSVDTMIANVKGMGESPAMFKKNGMYYLLTSNLTSWERNDNYYFTATNIAGPWKKQGVFCPEGTLTWNSQSTFVLMLPDGTPMYMGDRWSYPHQASAATYVWMPLQVDGEKLSIPSYWQSWNVQMMKSEDILNQATYKKPFLLNSNQTGKSIRLDFVGTHVAVVGRTNSHSGYALVSVLNHKKDTVYSSLIDFYSKVPQEGVRVITPQLPYDHYTLEVKVTGERSNWSDKRKNLYGSDDYFINTNMVYVFGKKAGDFRIQAGEEINIQCDTSAVEPVVKSAIRMFAEDCKDVLESSVVVTPKTGDILLHIDSKLLKGKKEAFKIAVKDGKIIVTGSDNHGLAYGLLEISRLLGVSPWKWWADAMPKKKSYFTLTDGYTDEQSPSVEYRGIFINDEDWGMMQWSSLNYEPWYKPGRIGPKTNSRIFELLLRLRANTFWPAMHDCTVPFFLTNGNREVAAQYGIYIGSSHCEPMACNANGEWRSRGRGEYDYVHNDSNVYRFWENRVKDVAHQPILYTIGMRGVHDGAMNGAKTLDEQRQVLERVFKDQRQLLAQYVNSDVTKIPQVFIPYKEVLDVYRSGLHVPEDVCLMWCDDNYGYIRHLPTVEERSRKGGNGIYYHVSYWGRPHDYLWLGTFSPALMFQQMSSAYENGIQKMWILNVGDLKPAEYQTEMFLDMAWNLDRVRKQGVKGHLTDFLCREFGDKIGKELSPIMRESYRLAFIRKPEFMGNTREEEYHTNYYRIVRDMPWSLLEIKNRLAEYEAIENSVEEIFRKIPNDQKDTYFQLVKYPVQAAAEMNKKMLFAQQARHGLCSWEKSDAAFDSISALTRRYNTGFCNQGKWHRMMDFQPRRLPVFEPVERSSSKEALCKEPQYIACFSGADCKQGSFESCEGLGYEEKAIMTKKGKKVIYDFECDAMDSVVVEVRMIPTHPLSGTQLRFQVSLDKQTTHVIDYATQGRSEEWKENVLSNHAIRRMVLPIGKKKKHQLTFLPLDEGEILDQIYILKN